MRFLLHTYTGYVTSEIQFHSAKIFLRNKFPIRRCFSWIAITLYRSVILLPEFRWYIPTSWKGEKAKVSAYTLWWWVPRITGADKQLKSVIWLLTYIQAECPVNDGLEETCDLANRKWNLEGKKIRAVPSTVTFDIKCTFKPFESHSTSLSATVFISEMEILDRMGLILSVYHEEFTHDTICEKDT